MARTPKFISLEELAAELGLPAAWLRAEADAGRIPSLRAGRRRMFNLESVEEVLIDRSASRAEAG